MSGRVTIACGTCKAPATCVNFYGWKGHARSFAALLCAHHADIQREKTRPNASWDWDYYLRLLNPGTCTDDDIANVRAFVEVVSRICRALWCDDAESREDLAVMRLCAEEVRFTLYEPCPLSTIDRGTIHGVTDVACPACHGTGIVLRDDARLDDERRAG